MWLDKCSIWLDDMCMGWEVIDITASDKLDNAIPEQVTDSKRI